jgi:hypothetical protein
MTSPRLQTGLGGIGIWTHVRDKRALDAGGYSQCLPRLRIQIGTVTPSSASVFELSGRNCSLFVLNCFDGQFAQRDGDSFCHAVADQLSPWREPGAHSEIGQLQAVHIGNILAVERRQSRRRT